MYLRLTRGRFDPAKSDEAMGLIPGILAAVQRQLGCQGVQAGVDRTTGATASVSTFDTLEHAQFSRDSLGDVYVRLQALGWQAEDPEIYETMQPTAPAE